MTKTSSSIRIGIMALMAAVLTIATLWLDEVVWAKSLASYGSGLTVEQAMVQKTKPFFLVFYTEWCPYCAKALPVIHQVAQAHQKQINLVLMDGDKPDSREWMDSFRVMGYPTIFMINPAKKRIERLHASDTYQQASLEASLKQFLSD